MDYAEGGTLWDVLESSPHDGRVLESDLLWWAPQLVSAIHWCHSQGFAHRYAFLASIADICTSLKLYI
jgi:serine/threonine protein kinase